MIGRIIDILNNPFYQLHFTTILDDIKPTPKLGESFFEGSRCNRPRGLCENGKINSAD